MAEDYKEWLKRAKSNLEIAKHSKLENVCYEDLCFEVQQCAEKALKAIFVFHNTEIPKVHSFHVILGEIERYYQIPSDIKEVEELNNYAVITRYPGDYDEITETEYKRALEIAERVYNWVCELIASN